ncbi:hypothetical protein [Sinomonas sp. R1AF57]|uniref:hypothetical protein n=1 Tax=Sinomonas sp. R1AF57 TaxID=2020377 RepID=UPI001ABFD0AA|nr:hypothetical protein [Sinomonas sp. R1AF57]
MSGVEEGRALYYETHPRPREGDAEREDEEHESEGIDAGRALFERFHPRRAD